MSNGLYAMKPLWKATWLLEVKSIQKIPGAIPRYYWKIVGFKQLQRTYVDSQEIYISLRQNRDSPTPQHCIGMFKRFAKLNGITHYKII